MLVGEVAREGFQGGAHEHDPVDGRPQIDQLRRDASTSDPCRVTSDPLGSISAGG
jgi:hypothetical protein